MPVLPVAPWQVSELSLFTAAWQWDVNVASKETRVWCRKYPWNVVKWLKPKKMNAIMKEIMIPHALHHYTTKKWFLTSLSVFKYNKTLKSLHYCCADTCISYCKCNASLKLGMVKEAILKWCTNFGIFSSHTRTQLLDKWVSEQQMALLSLPSPPKLYYPQAAPPPTTANMFESVNLQRDNALRPILGGKEKMSLPSLLRTETNDTREVWEIVMVKNLWSKCFSVKKTYSLLSCGDFFLNFLFCSIRPLFLPASLYDVFFGALGMHSVNCSS